jgi:alkylation response protein AidB-like acyl-CoA dehydrogenase
VTIAPAAPAPASQTDAGHAHWLHVARELADDLATDAVERERAGKPPLDEVERLREAGLLTLLAATAHGGGGADWRTAYAVVRTISAADAAIGELLGVHYFLSSGARFFAGPARAERVERESAAGRWCWSGGIASDQPSLMLNPGANGHLLDGRLSCAVGAGVADRLLVRASRTDTGEPLAVVVDPSHPGVVRGTGGETFGQRPAAGGSVAFDSVPVTADDVFGSLSADDGVLSPFAGLAAPTARLVSAQVCLGAAEGLLAEARELSRPATASGQPSDPLHWPVLSGAPHWPVSPAQDPYVLGAYGELAVTARSAAALADQAVDALMRGLARGEELDDDEGAEITVLAGAAEAAASRAAQEITTRALDVIGARAASTRYGLDRFWRNARTHTLRTPVSSRLREAGDYHLNGTHPPFTLP